MPSAEVTKDGLVDQVASLEDLAQGKIDANAFFQRNHFTDGLRRLVQTGFERLSGRSDTGAYYLTQAMGGGKTHALIAFGLLAASPALRERVVPDLAATAKFGAAKVVMFNGHQNPENLLWGFVAEALGRPDTMSRFWRQGPLVPGIDDWKAAIGTDEPVLILLDELPSYLQMAQGQPVGNTTLGEITIGALERLFNALPQLPNVCVVVTNLKDDVYLDGSNQLKALIEALSKQYDRTATAITPVQQNTGEVFEIIRKRLFDQLPDAGRIDEVGQAYVAALEQAKRVDTIPATPETFLARIRETYPFHPSIRDIVGRFSENRGYQKTRALIRLLRLAVRAAMSSDDNVFLVGLQHLDLSDQLTLEEIRKINSAYTNAISKDINDRGNALAEKIDELDGSSLAEAIAKTLLMASLSSAENPVRGLREGELYECLVDPLVKVSDLKSSLEKYVSQAWYLQKDAQDRIYVSQTANVTAEINEVALNIAEELVDQTLRTKLKEVFRPRTGALYDANMAVLPALDEIDVGEDRVTLVILERPAEALPADFEQWWQGQERQNSVLVLTADPNAVGSMRGLARRMRAIDKVEESARARHGASSSQMTEIQNIRDKETASFTSALREAFKTLIYPMSGRLRAYGDLRMEFQGNDYSGEEQILKTLAERAKFIPSDQMDANFDQLRQDAEEILFDADSMQASALRRNAAARPGWLWLPRGGLESLTRLAVQRGFWRERDGLVQKKFEIVTSVSARTDEFGPSPLETGRFTLNVSKQDADTVYVSESGPPDPKSAAKLSGLVYDTEAAAVWFIAVDSTGKAKTGEVFEWRARVRLRAQVTSTPAGIRLSVETAPRAAIVRASFDGSDPQQASPINSGLLLDPGATQVRVIAELGGSWSDEENIPVGPRGGVAEPGKPMPPTLKDDLPVSLRTRFLTSSTAHAFSSLTALRDLPTVRIAGGRIEVKGRSDTEAFVTLRFGSTMPMPATELDALVKLLTEKSGFADPEVSLILESIIFSAGRDFRTFAERAMLDFERQEWTQP